MARQKQGSFKMKGHTLPGINQRSETANIGDGRSPSSAFQMAEPGSSPHKGFGSFLKKSLNPLTGIKAGIGGIKAGIGATKSLLKGDIKGAAGALNPKNLLGGGGGGDDDAGAGAELLKAEAKAAMEEQQA